MALSVISVLLILTSPTLSFSTSTEFGLRTHMTHVDSGRNYTKLELLQRSLLRSNRRMARLAGGTVTAASLAVDGLRVPVHPGEGEFLMDLAIGTPPTPPFPAIVDTGSDLVWTQCQPCTECYEQPTPIFVPSSSSTYSTLPCASDPCRALPEPYCGTAGDQSGCQYTYSYGDSSITKGVLARETFTLGSPPDNASVPGVAFGCGVANSGVGFKQASGLVGLGRGPLSLVSQLGVGRFSYCLTKYGESKTSPLLFGSLATTNAGVQSTARVQSTPLVRNPNQPTFYYLSLMGITVGGSSLAFSPKTFGLGADGSGGLIIDSGTSITYLEGEGYDAVKKAFLAQVKLPVADGSQVGLDLCFKVENSSTTDPKVPELVFHFEGADLVLPVGNYMIQDPSNGLLCLAIARASGMSILGNFQQQGMLVVHDLENDVLSFAPAKCEEL